MKKLLAIFIAFVTLFCVTGCGLFNKDNEKEKKYDVTIKVTSNHGGEWIFTPDIEEMHIEIPYDGLERRFYVSQYQLKDDPACGDAWFLPDLYDKNYFESNWHKINQKYNEERPSSICEKGEYVYSCSTSTVSYLWRYRKITLYITIK